MKILIKNYHNEVVPLCKNIFEKIVLFARSLLIIICIIICYNFLNFQHMIYIFRKKLIAIISVPQYYSKVRDVSIFK